MKRITLGGGCFWCIETIYSKIRGITAVTSGYMGGHMSNPTYREVCNGTTGHVEVCQLIYQSDEITLAEILDIFWVIHDPTTLNRQGNDIGTQYRSAIFYHDEDQLAIINTSHDRAQRLYQDPIVTEVLEAAKFYPAEDYHQQYYQHNSAEAYCRIVIEPKIIKARAKFSHLWVREDSNQNTTE